MKSLYLTIVSIFILSCTPNPDAAPSPVSNSTTTPTPSIISVSGAGVTDIDGNTYTSIVLGNGQEWMSENLRTKRYCNGDSIKNIKEDSLWLITTNGAWAYYENDSLYDLLFGKIYNGYSVLDNRNICPCNWHVPSSNEWDNLVRYLLPGATLSPQTVSPNGPDYLNHPVGSALKSSDTLYWNNLYRNSTNSSNFNALPGGLRYGYGDGIFSSMDYGGYWWTSTSQSQYGTIWWRGLDQTHYMIYSRFPYTMGMSVRCIKD